MGRDQDQFPEVTTDDVEREITSALGPGPQDETLSSSFKMNVTREDMQTLQKGQWLNDEIINFYMSLLMERSKPPGFPAPHTFGTLTKEDHYLLGPNGQKRPDILVMIFQYLQDESKVRRDIDLNPMEWKQHSMTAEEIPLQLNQSDCGMFTCKYADYISREQPITFSQQHVPLFRKQMV
ncbi:Sentrin-specific protease 2 [Microtus ochrogaster]|uniref:Sentrin-specific protease 2 n=1 Tax=Microtus ochrogaster TaxID=79684 RepID=A0A8J6FYP3_MICOH|nr:Sentrin-specific protease 2 [Microtus ochrogaster]